MITRHHSKVQLTVGGPRDF